MGIVSDLEADVIGILKTRWQSRDGRVVPEAEDVKLGNDAVKLDGTVLYADLADSTELVKKKSPAYAAEVYKCYTVRQAIGIDTSSLFVAKTGVRGANDLVWVGRAANIAAKLCSLRVDTYSSWITEAVYSKMNYDVKYADGRDMWEKRTWMAQGITVYRSSWYWAAS